MITAHTIHHHPEGAADYTLSLTYEDRFLRRKKLITDCGMGFILDLEQTTSLDHGDHIECTDGTHILVQAKPETLAQITGANLLELAWHIGNRHTPCQIEASHLLIQRDHVREGMLRLLGAEIEPMQAPFTPEGGAYGHGRTHSHHHDPEHGPEHDQEPHNHHHH